MNLSRFFFLLSFFFFLCFVGVYYQQNNPQNITFADSELLKFEDIKQESVYPSGIVISSIHVWLPVYKASIHDGTWETTNKGISYLQSSAQVGSTGNAIFYGHDWPNLLGNLKNIHTGDIIQIITISGKQMNFEVSTIQEVNPTDISVLSQTNDSRITIYTCSGIFDSKRLVVVALLKK